LLFSLLSVPPFFFSFFFYCSGLHRDLLSFPTRRSSDLSSLVFLWFLFRFLFRFFLLRLFCFLLRLYLISVFLFTLLELLVIPVEDRKSTRLNSSHVSISYAVFCLKKKKEKILLIKISFT